MVNSSAEKPFKADRPFLYYIMDPRTTTTIFSGRYKGPSMESDGQTQNTKKLTRNDEL